MIEEALNLSVDLITTLGIGTDFRNGIAGTEILLYEIKIRTKHENRLKNQLCKLKKFTRFTQISTQFERKNSRK